PVTGLVGPKELGTAPRVAQGRLRLSSGRHQIADDVGERFALQFPRGVPLGPLLAPLNAARKLPSAVASVAVVVPPFADVVAAFLRVKASENAGEVVGLGILEFRGDERRRIGIADDVIAMELLARRELLGGLAEDRLELVE